MISRMYLWRGYIEGSYTRLRVRIAESYIHSISTYFQIHVLYKSRVEETSSAAGRSHIWGEDSSIFIV